MHTEDDTFRKLKQTPFAQVRTLIREANRSGRHGSAIKMLLKYHGWTPKEYMKELYEHS